MTPANTLTIPLGVQLVPEDETARLYQRMAQARLQFHPQQGYLVEESDLPEIVLSLDQWRAIG